MYVRWRVHCSVAASQAMIGTAFFSLVLLVSSLVSVPGRKTGQGGSHFALRIYEIANCGDPVNYATFLEPITIKLGRDGGHMVDVNLSLAKTVTTIQKGMVRLTRCREALSSNTCEYFGTWAFSSACGLITRKHVIWSPVVDSVTPTIRCPLKKGIYTATNTTCDINVPFIRSIVDGFVLKGRVTFLDQDGIEFLCGYGTIGGIKVRGGTAS